MGLQLSGANADVDHKELQSSISEHTVDNAYDDDVKFYRAVRLVARANIFPRVERRVEEWNKPYNPLLATFKLFNGLKDSRAFNYTRLEMARSAWLGLGW